MSLQHRISLRWILMTTFYSKRSLNNNSHRSDLEPIQLLVLVVEFLDNNRLKHHSLELNPQLLEDNLDSSSNNSRRLEGLDRLPALEIQLHPHCLEELKGEDSINQQQVKVVFLEHRFLPKTHLFSEELNQQLLLHCLDLLKIQDLEIRQHNQLLEQEVDYSVVKLTNL